MLVCRTESACSSANGWWKFYSHLHTKADQKNPPQKKKNPLPTCKTSLSQSAIILGSAVTIMSFPFTGISHLVLHCVVSLPSN